MAKLSLRHVSKRYPNGFWAVKDFNLEMEDGEFVILTGSPKCGKSTVLRMIAGAEDVTEGILFRSNWTENRSMMSNQKIGRLPWFFSITVCIKI